jgi:hypothetical protein
MGTTPTFKATFYTRMAEWNSVALNACMADKLSLPTKVDDWTIISSIFASSTPQGRSGI